MPDAVLGRRRANRRQEGLARRLEVVDRVEAVLQPSRALRLYLDVPIEHSRYLI